MPPDSNRRRHVKIRPLRSSDAPALALILRDRLATRFLPPRVRRETGRQFVQRVLREQRRGNGRAFVVQISESRLPIGQIRLLNWSPMDREAEVGFWVRRKFWGRGLGTEALRLTCQYGFRKMSLHRIEALVVAGNVRSRRALERVGFRFEGRSRRSTRLGRQWVDTWRFGLLRSEFRPK
jgi:RimJ/RimL family protein N-acetyltransferase